jgi:protein arginine kinase
MADTSQTPGAGGAWYSGTGAEGDVILSTRVRLARDLANFPFPENFRGDDGMRVQTLVFDSFSRFENPDQYQVVDIGTLDGTGTRILSERGVLDTPAGTGLVIRSDGRVCCTVNSSDHVRIAAFVPGLDGDSALGLCRTIDESMQQSLQFAASYDFGFLTASVNDAGSGMKLSFRAHLPAVSFCGKTAELSQSLQEKGFSLSACFGAGSAYGASLGSYYQIASVSAFNGSELDQLAALTAAGKYVAETERKFRRECAENKPTAVRDCVYRAYAAVKFGRFVTQREAVGIISGIKWGRDTGLLNGVEDSELCALLYRIQEGHLGFLLGNGSFNFEKDVEQDPAQKMNRLRALILQEAFENIGFSS